MWLLPARCVELHMQTAVTIELAHRLKYRMDGLVSLVGGLKQQLSLHLLTVSIA